LEVQAQKATGIKEEALGREARRDLFAKAQLKGLESELRTEEEKAKLAGRKEVAEIGAAGRERVAKISASARVEAAKIASTGRVSPDVKFHNDYIQTVNDGLSKNWIDMPAHLEDLEVSGDRGIREWGYGAPMTPDIAQQYLNQAGGDVATALQWAYLDGWKVEVK
jgi:hypothetical protein